jgi:erythronate-4-phosphate dehydrogenase
MPPPAIPEIELDARPRSEAGAYCGEEALREAALKVYPIERDDAALRKLGGLPPADQGPYFDRLRAEYPVRREFQNTTVRLRGPASAAGELAGKLKGIGFNVA